MANADRPKNFIITFASGAEPIVLDELLTAELYKRADEEGVDPGTFFLADLTMRSILMKKGWLNPITYGKKARF